MAPPARVRRWNRDHRFPGAPGAPSVCGSQRENPFSSDRGVHRWWRWTRRSSSETLVDWTGLTGSILHQRRPTPARRSPTPLKHAGGLPGTSGAASPAASTSHISSDGKTKLPGVPVPPPLLFPPVSPDLSAIVFSPSLCLTGGLSGVVTHAAAFIPAGQGLPHNTAITLQMERVSREGRDERSARREIPLESPLGDPTLRGEAEFPL